MPRPCDLVGKPLTCNGTLCENTIYGNLKGQNVYYFDKAKFYTGGCSGDTVSGTMYCNFTPRPDSLGFGYSGYKSKTGLAECLPWTWTENNPYKRSTVCDRYRSLTLADIEYNACYTKSGEGSFADFQRREDFCNSLVDIGGNPKKPRACGGTDPDIIYTDLTGSALEKITPFIKELSDAADLQAQSIVNSKRKTAVAIVLVLLLMLLLINVL